MCPNLKPHPHCVEVKTLHYLRQGLSFKEAKKKAEEECLRGGKLHGSSKLKCLVSLLEQRLEELEREKEAEKSESSERVPEKSSEELGMSVEDSNSPKDPIRQKILKKIDEISKMCDLFSKSSSESNTENGEDGGQS
jgi:hypothetical protein